MLPFVAVGPMDVATQPGVGLRVEERVRRGSDISAAETEIDPTLKLDFIWSGGKDRFSILYSPRILLDSYWNQRFPDERLVNRGTINTRDPNKTPFSYLNNGGIDYESVHDRWRLSLQGFGAYGQISTTAILVQPVWDGDDPPPDPFAILPATVGARFTLLFAQAQLSVPIKLTPRLALIPAVNYNAFGGADRESKGVIALSRGPGASLGLDWAATKNDRFLTQVGAGIVNNDFQDEQASVTIYRGIGTESWQHFYGKHVSHVISGGGSFGGDSVNGYELYSLGSATILFDSWPTLRLPPGAAPQGTIGRGHRVQVGLTAKTEPWIDVFSGDLENRFTTSAAVNYTVDRVTWRAYVAQSHVFNTPQSVARYQIVIGEAGLKYRFTRELSGDVGIRLGYQNFSNAVRFNELSQFTGSVGFTYAPIQRF